MAPTEDRRPPGILLFVLIAAMAAGPVLNYGLSALSPQIIETYDITEGQYGLIITIVFLIAGLSATVLGALSDRMPVRLQQIGRASCRGRVYMQVRGEAVREDVG